MQSGAAAQRARTAKNERGEEHKKKWGGAGGIYQFAFLTYYACMVWVERFLFYGYLLSLMWSEVMGRGWVGWVGAAALSLTSLRVSWPVRYVYVGVPGSSVGFSNTKAYDSADVPARKNRLLSQGQREGR